MSEKEMCDTCRFARDVGESRPWLECRRGPPVIRLPNSNAGAWPVVDGERGWCGEWAAKGSDGDE